MTTELAFPKPHRERLQGEEYRALIHAVFERDRWRCRCCGARNSLTPHHIQKKSQLGGNTLGNLITLCLADHQSIEANELKVEVVDVIVKFKKADGKEVVWPIRR